MELLIWGEKNRHDCSACDFMIELQNQFLILTCEIDVKQQLKMRGFLMLPELFTHYFFGAIRV